MRLSRYGCGPVAFNVKPLVCYVAVAIGFGVFGLGFVLMPGWWKLAWVAGCLGVLMVLPSILGTVLDPLIKARIRAYCRRVGATEVMVEAFPNHYGVHFQKNQKEHYAKCQLRGWQLRWKGLSPGDVQ